MKLTRSRLLALALACLFGTTAALAGTEKDIPVSKVPKKVLEAAAKAVPGIKFTEAEVQKTSKGIVYEIEGTAAGKKYEITVTAEGKVLKTEEDNDKEDEDEGMQDKKERSP